MQLCPKGMFGFAFAIERTSVHPFPCVVCRLFVAGLFFSYLILYFFVFFPLRFAMLNTWVRRVSLLLTLNVSVRIMPVWRNGKSKEKPTQPLPVKGTNTGLCTVFVVLSSNHARSHVCASCVCVYTSTMLLFIHVSIHLLCCCSYMDYLQTRTYYAQRWEWGS